MNRAALWGGFIAIAGAAGAYWLLVRQQTASLTTYSGGSDVPVQPAVSSNAWSGNSIFQGLSSIIQSAENSFSLPGGLLANLLGTESSYRPDVVSGAVTSRTGASGIAQFMPATAAQYGVDPTNPSSAIPGAANLLSDLYNQFGNWSYAVAAYNWGSGNLSKWLASGKTTPVPAETQNYVQKITGSPLV